MIGNNFFLSGNEVGMVYVRRFYFEDFSKMVVAHVSTYCGVVMVMGYDAMKDSCRNDVEKDKEETKKDK